ncbi:Leucine carboxyl methyltransferase 1 [Vitis vinifera]|uniref:[phosphatase 2A protein]-leucine-carboxy methyltransferase n=1 Tax=Vitis vinifera TaxID=29760 RepID=A0A438HJC3_VITVI|nr:Leucine carboxyl methyltransferase 1 [Vitis vinifera]
MKDDYIHLFVRRPVRRSPIINRGMVSLFMKLELMLFARWAALRKLLYQFLSCERDAKNKVMQRADIITWSWFDTTYFQLQDEGKAPYIYVELDFKEVQVQNILTNLMGVVTSKKAAIIETCSQLRTKLEQQHQFHESGKGEMVFKIDLEKTYDHSGGNVVKVFRFIEFSSQQASIAKEFKVVWDLCISWRTTHLVREITTPVSRKRSNSIGFLGEVLSDHYKLLPVDLRDIQKLDDVIAMANMDPSLPTFIIAECVLIYLDPDSSRGIVAWASKKFSTAVFFLYEQIHPDDAFGQQMIRNLEVL